MTHTSPFRWYLGHRCIRVLALLSEVLEALRVLVVEAVGVGTGRAMAAAVPVGTRFVTADAAERTLCTSTRRSQRSQSTLPIRLSRLLQRQGDGLVQR
jgi:hypothetical protein